MHRVRMAYESPERATPLLVVRGGSATDVTCGRCRAGLLKLQKDRDHWPSWGPFNLPTAPRATLEIVEASPGLPEQIKRELEGLDALKAALAARGCTFGTKGENK